MSEQNDNAVRGCGGEEPRAVCLDGNKIYDSCRDRDCVENMRVYFPRSAQALVDRGVNLKAKSAEIIWTYIDVEPVPFSRGYYQADIRFYVKVTADSCGGLMRNQEVSGFCVYDKKVILFGSEGNARSFSSEYVAGGCDGSVAGSGNLPVVVVDVVEPIVLASRVEENCAGRSGAEPELASLPDFVNRAFCGEDFAVSEAEKRLYVSLGIFSLTRIQRNVQLLVPSYEFSVPEKECTPCEAEDPCCLFGKLRFPVDQFFPPETLGDDPRGEGGCGCRG